MQTVLLLRYANVIYGLLRTHHTEKQSHNWNVLALLDLFHEKLSPGDFYFSGTSAELVSKVNAVFFKIYESSQGSKKI